MTTPVTVYCTTWHRYSSPPYIRGTNPFNTGVWNLSAGHYVAAKFVPVITYPRPDLEVSSDAYCKNAYTGLAWEIPIVVQGGAWPFKYEVTTGPSGMVIGETLAIDGDHQQVDSAYGVLSWPTPTAGTHSIKITVTDQDLTEKTVEWDLVVGTTNHVFIDAAAASEGVGTIGDPLKTFNVGLYESSNTADTYVGKVAHFKTGSYVINNGTSTQNTTLNPLYKPRSYVAYPGQTPTFDVTDAAFWTNTAIDDFYVGGIIFDGTKATAGNHKSINIASGSDRATLYNLTFNNTNKGTVGTDNPACIAMMTGTTRQYASVIRCTLGTTSSIQLYTGFDVDYLVCEHNVGDGVTYADSNGGYFIHPKESTSNVTLRANHATDTVMNGVSLINVYGQSTGNDNIESCWNTLQIESGSSAGKTAEYWTGNTSGSSSNEYSYRNTIVNKSGRVYAALANVTVTYLNSQENLKYGTSADLGNITESNNQTVATTDFDVNWELTGTARTNYLGTRGAEIA